MSIKKDKLTKIEASFVTVKTHEPEPVRVAELAAGTIFQSSGVVAMKLDYPFNGFEKLVPATLAMGTAQVYDQDRYIDRIVVGPLVPGKMAKDYDTHPDWLARTTTEGVLDSTQIGDLPTGTVLTGIGGARYVVNTNRATFEETYGDHVRSSNGIKKHQARLIVLNGPQAGMSCHLPFSVTLATADLKFIGVLS